MIGQIRSTLASLGVDQNTYVFFSSDNGLHMGEYSLRPGKMTPFEIDIHVPLIVVGPGVAKGQVVNEIVENIDLYPTFTDLAEASSSNSPDGHSLVPLLRGETVSDWRRLALIEHHHHGPVPDPNDPDRPMPHSANPPTYEALRTENGTYVEYDDGEVGYYDLVHDPDELRNIAGRLLVAQRQRLHDVLNANKQCRGTPACWDAQRMAIPGNLADSQAVPPSSQAPANNFSSAGESNSAANTQSRVARPSTASAPAATTNSSQAAPAAGPTSANPAAASGAPTSEATGLPSIHFVPGSTIKVQQLIGDEDKERHQPTLSRTVTRYQLQGTDLGYSFEHSGRVYFLFGDTVGKLDRAFDTIAATDARDPEAGVRLDFLTVGSDYLTIRPPGISMGAFEVPVSGISLDGQMYVVVSTNHSPDRTTDRSVLTKFAPPSSFKPLRTISQLPEGRFVKMSMHAQPGPMAGLPSGGPFIIIWGTGQYRKSDAYLSIVPAANFETGQGTRYFAGLDATGAPTWSDKESDARPIVQNGTMGDLSVTWCKDPSLWLMTYDSRSPAPRGILFSYSRTPWGPWSEPQIIFNAERDGAVGKFIHDPRIEPDDGLAGPVIGKGQANPGAVHGGAYAPYVVERFTKLTGPELSLYYVLSTWNPYVVILMKSRLRIN
jgi:hypothetical protein